MNEPTPFSIYRPIVGIIAGVTVLLLIPFIASFFTAQVNWTGSDYITAAFLLSVTGIAYVCTWRKAKSRRIAAMLGIIITFLLLAVWAHLAVGIF